MSLQKSLQEQAQSIREEAKKVRERYPGIANEGKPIESQVWECSAEHGQLRFTKRPSALHLERVFIIAILSCFPPAAWHSLGQPSFLGLFIAFSLSTVPFTILILRWDVFEREYLIDKDTDSLCRDGEQLCRLTEIDRVRIATELCGGDYGGDYYDDVAYVVFGDRKERIPLELAHEIASYIGVKVKGKKPPSTGDSGIITLDL